MLLVESGEIIGEITTQTQFQNFLLWIADKKKLN